MKFYLQPSFAELFHCNFKLCGRIFCTLDQPFVDTPKAALSDHDRAAEVLCGRLQLRNCEHSEVAGSLREVGKRHSSRGFGAGVGDILGVQFRARSPRFAIGERRIDGGLKWCWFCVLGFIFFVSKREKETLHGSKNRIKALQLQKFKTKDLYLSNSWPNNKIKPQYISKKKSIEQIPFSNIFFFLKQKPVSISFQTRVWKNLTKSFNLHIFMEYPLFQFLQKRKK